jgi:hypothetical protein
MIMLFLREPSLRARRVSRIGRSRRYEIVAADSAMYSAKTAGRDRAIIAPLPRAAMRVESVTKARRSSSYARGL